MNYYPRHIGDYAKDTGHLTMLEHGAYTLLLDRYYATEAGIPDDQKYRLSRARTKEEKEAVDAVLSEFFTLEAGIWKKPRCEAEIAKAQKKISAAITNGASGGRPRKNPEVTKEKPSGLFVGSDLESQSKALQSPISNLQKEIHVELPSAPQPNGHSTAIPTDVTTVFNHWRVTWSHEKAKLDTKREKAIRRALKSYDVTQLCTAISGYRNSPHHRGENERNTPFDDVELFLRDAKHIEVGIQLSAKGQERQWT